MIYYKLHEKGYKFCDRVQDLTRAQIAYLGKAMEVEAENQPDIDIGNMKNGKVSKSKLKGKKPNLNKSKLKNKYKNRVKNKGGGNNG